MDSGRWARTTKRKMLDDYPHVGGFYYSCYGVIPILFIANDDDMQTKNHDIDIRSSEFSSQTKLRYIILTMQEYYYYDVNKRHDK